jgi:hypothetical protein
MVAYPLNINGNIELYTSCGKQNGQRILKRRGNYEEKSI